MSNPDPKIIDHVDDPTATPSGKPAEVVTAQPIGLAPAAERLRRAGETVAKATVLGQQIEEIIAGARAEYAAAIAETHRATGATSFGIDVTGQKVATATIREQKAATAVAGPKALLEWVEAHKNWQDVGVETTRRVHPTFQASLLADIEWVAFDPDEPEVEVDPDDPWADVSERLPESRYVDEEKGIYLRAVHVPTGEFPPGLTYTPGRMKTESFALRFTTPPKGAAKSEIARDGKRIVADHLHDLTYEQFVDQLVTDGVLQIDA